MNFNNPEDRKAKLESIRARCVEMPPPSEKNLADKCWISPSKIDEDLIPINIYSSGKLQGDSHGMHVITLMLANGIKRNYREDGKEVMHLCNRKACCNPAHLELGTRKENNDDAIADDLFDPRGQTGIPKPSIQGEDNPRARASNRQAAEAKYLFSHPEEWFVPEISDHHSMSEAIAIHLNMSQPSLKRIEYKENWKHVEPLRPETFPSIETVPANAKPPVPHKTGPIGEDNARSILKGYWASKDRPGYISGWMAKLNVSRTSIQNVLSGKTWREVEPEIPREIDFSSHRHTTLSDRDVQHIRATFAADPTVHGLQAALARKFDCEDCSIGLIVRRLARLDVPDDPTAIIPLEELEFKPTAQRGEAHKLCKLSDAAVLEILERHSAGDSPVKLSIENGVSYVLIYNIVRGKTRKKIWERFHRERREREQDGEQGGENGGGE